MDKIIAATIIWIVTATALAAPIQIQTGPIGSGKIYTPCAFDGSTIQCAFDSGSARSTVLDAGIFENYPAHGTTTQIGASGKRETCDWIEFQAFSAADATLTTTLVPRCPTNTLGNVVGINFFQGKTLHLDPKKQELEELDTPVPNEMTKQQLLLSPNGHLLIPTTIMGLGDVQSMWDTGAGLTTVDKTIVQAHPNLFKLLQQIPVPDSSGQVQQANLYSVDSVVVGGQTFQNVSMIAMDLTAVRTGIGQETNLILGFNVISQASWYFDLRALQWAAIGFSN